MRLLFLILSLLLPVGCITPNHQLEGQTVPQSVFPLEDRPYVIAWISGEAVQLGVDTGASQSTVLFSNVIEYLGGRIRGKGSVRTTNLDVVLYYKQEKGNEPQAVAMVPHSDFAGLMGWPMIRKFVWHINFPGAEHKFTFSVPFWVRNSYTSMSLVTHDDLPHIQDAYNHKIVIDTGAPHGIYLNKSHWKEWKEKNPYAFITLYDGFSPAAGGSYARECARAKSFVLNGVEFKNILIAESFVDREVMKLDREIDIMIGLEALRSREIWIDGEGEKIYFGPNRSKSVEKLPLNLVGAVFVPRTEGRHSYEAVVLKESVAWQAGLRNGDRLVSLNGRRYPDAELISFLTCTPGAHVSISVQRKGRTKQIKWTVPSEEDVQPKPPDEPQPDNGNIYLQLPVFLEGFPALPSPHPIAVPPESLVPRPSETPEPVNN